MGIEYRAWSGSLRLVLGVSLLATAGCDTNSVEVSDPFYLSFIDVQEDTMLVRCIEAGCAGDKLPDATVFAAGADKTYVTVARHPREGDKTDCARTEYYYFKRVPEEKSGWGNNPEKIVGPLTESEFDAAKARLGLPEFTTRPYWLRSC